MTEKPSSTIFYLSFLSVEVKNMLILSNCFGLKDVYMLSKQNRDTVKIFGLVTLKIESRAFFLRLYPVRAFPTSVGYNKSIA